MLSAEPWGCSTQLVSPTPSSDCSMERESSGEAGVRESSGKEAGISPLCPPGAQHQPLPAPHPAFAALGWVLSLHSGHRTWQDPASPKNYQQLDTAQGTLRPTQCSVPSAQCPLTATRHVLPPTHSRCGAIPQTWPAASRPHPASCKKGNHWFTPSALQTHLQSHQLGGTSGLGTDRQTLSPGQPGTPGCYCIEFFSPLPL